MESIKLTESDVAFFRDYFEKLSKGDASLAQQTQLAVLNRMINTYALNGTTSFPTEKESMYKIVAGLKEIPKETAAAIALQAKTICKTCLFHNESCLINLIFIAFKSIELNKEVEFKNMRPNVRIVY